MNRLLSLLAVAAMGFLATVAVAADLDTARSELEAILTQENEPLLRGRRVKTLLGIDTEDAAKVAVELLPQFAESQAARVKAAYDLREKYEPYKGRSFKDPAAWDIKKRLQGEMDAADTAVRDDGVVARTWVAGIAGLTSPDAVAVFERAFSSVSPEEAKRIIASGLVRNAQLTELEDFAKKAMRDSDPGVRLVTLQGLAERKDPSTLDLCIKALKESGWPHRLAAAEALAGIGDVRAVAPLIDAIVVEEGRLIEDFADALAALTGQQLGAEPAAWRAWYEDNKETLAESGAKPKSTKRVKKLDRTVVDFYGVKTRSRRVMFLIDISGSMKDPLTEERGTTTGEGDDDLLKGPKIEVAKRLLKQAIRNLSEETYFNIITFNHVVKTFQPTMIQAKQANKNDAYLMINDLEPMGATFTYGALKESFRLGGRGVSDKAYDPGVDTIILLSDGAPTDDSIDNAKPMDAKKILDQVDVWNGLSKVKIHTIAIDPGLSGGGFHKFMKALAKRNGGSYTPIGKK